ncbi:MAG: hypothetical protein JO069_21825 [Verrucomicrobia bacterium]|nr:hypothetical protein [Verrucomicrobiota bacterium]
MQTFYADLASALEERLAIIADETLRTRQPYLQLQKLQAVSARIDALKAQLPPDTDPRLKHYLERSSLTKALEFIRAHHLASRP